MSRFERYRGAGASGPLQQNPDQRIVGMDAGLRAVEALTPGLVLTSFARDSFSQYQVGRAILGNSELIFGLVIHAMPHLGWYKVQVAEFRGFIGACMLTQGSVLPLGVRDTSVIPPNSPVLLYAPHGLDYAFILGVMPPILYTASIANPDWLCQGTQTGLRREPAHTYPLANHYKGGGALDFSAQRPWDGTGQERGMLSATGIGWMISEFETWLRVNEQCGLFLNSFDSHARLAGVALDVVSAIHEETTRDDEGEARLMRGVATYPWEALGLYAPDTKFTQEYTDEEVAHNRPVAKLDLPENARDLQALYRWTEYGGYLGQGHMRLLSRPPTFEGLRRYSDVGPPSADTAPPAKGAAAPEEGLFCESIGIDGSYTLRSAKSVLIGRRVKIVVPREYHLPEDSAGDDAAYDDAAESDPNHAHYRFSGQFGTKGAPHKLAEVAITGAYPSMRKVAAASDLVAFACNWKTLHPFHYHKGDYRTAQESAQKGTFEAVQDKLDFSELEHKPFMSDPQAVVLKIDHRYTDANYYMRESALHLLDDGGVVLSDGYGARLVLSGGHIRAEAPGDIQLVPGRDLVALAAQIILRAHQSADISAAQHDVRIKAEKHVQILAGNSGMGAILLESKAKGCTHLYDSRLGEDVVSNGIVMRAATSCVATLAGGIYLRTGGADLNNGDIVLDAGKGTGRVQLYADTVNAYAAQQVAFFLGPFNETSTVNQTYLFGPEACILDATTLIGGNIFVYAGTGGGSSMYIDGNVYGTGNIAAAGVVASNQGMFLAQVPDGFSAAIQRVTSAATADAADAHQAGTFLHTNTIVNQVYQPMQLGNDALVPTLQFSFRDMAKGEQYHTEEFAWIERHWEQLVRLGGGSGGGPWKEPAVVYQGQETFPWPGRKAWKELKAFLQLTDTTMFDTKAGQSRDRPGPYETKPHLANWTTTTMEEGYRLVR